jgi:hypothetical protein
MRIITDIQALSDSELEEMLSQLSELRNNDEGDDEDEVLFWKLLEERDSR